MDITVHPAKRVTGHIELPGDKSISHRLALLGAISTGKTTVENFASSQDCHSTLDCLKTLGIDIEKLERNRIVIHGKGLDGLAPPLLTLDACNSGSTIRMLSGILAGQQFQSTISGDDSLRQRPMKRVIIPLQQMGAIIQARLGDFPPLTIKGTNLKPIRYTLPVASAQVKSAILLAGLYAEGSTTIVEPVPTRNHTELALGGFGGHVSVEGNSVTISGRQKLHGIHTRVPGDISSAAFFLAGAALLGDSEVRMEGVGLNAGRRGILDLMRKMGASIEIGNERIHGGEPVADLCAKTSELMGGKISGDQIPRIIDEIPILAVLGTQTINGIEIRDASELRVKESDRIRGIVDNLRNMGAAVEEYPDGLAVSGQQSLKGTRITTRGDHRIAMAFAIAALLARGETVIQEAECAAVSFPGFFEILQRLIVR